MSFLKEELNKFDKEFPELVKMSDYQTYRNVCDKTKVKSFITASHLRLLERVIEIVESDRVQLREPDDHLPNVYQYLKGKNDLRDTILQELKNIKE